MSRLRAELWSNRSEMPADLSKFDGQKGDTVVIEATQWSCAWGHPDIGEVLCIRHFDSIKARTKHMKEIRKQYGQWLYELG